MKKIIAIIGIAALAAGLIGINEHSKTVELNCMRNAKRCMRKITRCLTILKNSAVP